MCFRSVQFAAPRSPLPEIANAELDGPLLEVADFLQKMGSCVRERECMVVTFPTRFENVSWGKDICIYPFSFWLSVIGTVCCCWFTFSFGSMSIRPLILLKSF